DAAAVPSNGWARCCAQRFARRQGRRRRRKDCFSSVSITSVDGSPALTYANFMKRFALSLLVLGVLLTPSLGSAQSLSGMWDATVVVPSLKNAPVPFRFEITQQGSNVKGSFFNG